MDEIIIGLMGFCGSLMLAVIPIATVIFAVQIRDLQKKIADLEGRLEKASPTLLPLERRVEALESAGRAPVSEGSGTAQSAAADPLSALTSGEQTQSATEARQEPPETATGDLEAQIEAPETQDPAPASAEDAPTQTASEGDEPTLTPDESAASSATGQQEDIEEAADEAVDQTGPSAAPATQSPEALPSDEGDGPRDPTPKPRSLEQIIGANLAIWGGAGALGLAAILLVQYGVQNDLIGPKTRIAIGGLFSLAMVTAGELLFRKVRAVGGGLVGAGIVGLYATIGGATALYGLLPPIVGGGLMLAITALAALLSIRHGLMIIAAIGLLGGFLTPLLIGVRDPDPWALMIYLTLLSVGVVTVAGKRKWPLLMVMAAGLSFVAEMGWLFGGPRQDSLAFMALMVGLLLPVGLASVFGLGFLPTRDPEEGPRSLYDRVQEAAQLLLVQTSLHISIVSSMVVVVSAAIWWKFPLSTWAVQLPLFALCMGLLLASPHMPRTLPGLAYGVALFHQFLFLLIQEPVADVARPVYLWVGLVFVGGLSLLTCWRPERKVEPILAMLIALVQFLMAYLHAYGGADEAWSTAQQTSWGTAAMAATVVFAALSIGAARRHRSLGNEGTPAAATILAVASVTFAFVATSIALESPWLTLAWLAMALPIVLLGQKVGSHVLTSAGIMFLAAAGFRLGLALDIESMRGGLPIVNWILVLYGAAVASALGCATAMGKGATWDESTRLVVKIVALCFFLALVTVEVRHLHNPGMSGGFTDAENLSYSIAWLSVGVGALIYGLMRKSVVARWVSLILMMGTSFKIFLFDLSFLDGLWRVGSLAGLGVILITIATLYRLFVFPGEETETR